MNIPPRGKYQGVAQIVRFNWPMYLGATLALAVGAVIIAFTSAPKIFLLAIALPAFWLIASLVVSHYVYDRSSIYTGDWLKQAVPKTPAHYAILHTGLDEFSQILRAKFPTSEAHIVDFFDAHEMTEPSILRARREQTATAKPASFRALPFPDEKFDDIFVIFAAHELRSTDSRVQFFRELKRILNAEGRIVLVEHLHDLPNFIAFGPGFFHFHSRVKWQRTISLAELSIVKEFGLTQFVRGFILEKALAGV